MSKTKRRPELNKIPLEQAMTTLLNRQPPSCLITMSIGQWDMLLSEAYRRGWILLELDDAELPVAAYQQGA